MNWIYDKKDIEKIELLDYVLDTNDNFWIVKCMKKDGLYGFIVYEKTTEKTIKFNHHTQKYYEKKSTDHFTKIENIKCFFKARDFYKHHKDKLEGVWKQTVLALNDIGVEDHNIGIFGSYLVGFDITKDVDYIVYGKENLKLVYDNIDRIKNFLNATSISPKHIEYQYEKHKSKYHKECDLKTIISRNWSGLQIRDGVLSTLRFIDDMTFPEIKSNQKIMRCKIISGLESACYPRKAICECGGEEYTIYTFLWKFQSFARDGDILEIKGNVDEKNHIITLEDENDYIKFLNK